MQPSTPRLVRDIMTRKIAVLHEEDNLELAEQGMKTHGFRHLPVVDADKLVGLVSERDLLNASISTLDSDHALLDDNLKRYSFVREIMKAELTTARPDMPLVDAAELLQQEKVGCLPVTEDDGKLVGILTRGDLIGLTVSLLRGQEVQ